MPGLTVSDIDGRSYEHVRVLVHLFANAYTEMSLIRSGNAHVITAFNDNFGITNNNKWTLALSIFYVGYCVYL